MRVCVRGPSKCLDVWLTCVLLWTSVCQWWCVDIGVCESTVRIRVRLYNFSQQKKGHRKLNIVHFLFKLFKQRHRLWRWQQSWILMSYCTCIRDMKQLGEKKKSVFSKHWHIKSAGASVVGINQVKVPHWVQSTFLYTISEVQFLLELKHSEREKKTSRSIADRLWETLFLCLCVSKDECLRGEEKIRGRKENIKREVNHSRMQDHNAPQSNSIKSLFLA